MSRGFFITGTDTGTGKTLIACALLRALALRGFRVAAMKPVASGCHPTGNGLRNDDANKLMTCASVALTYDIVNPYALPAPIAPHLAAREIGMRIKIDTIIAAYRAAASQADCVVVEGAGGWLVPINESETMADLAEALQIPVILVAGIRLGCINHALLTTAAMDARRVGLAGWIANTIDPECMRSADIVSSLRERIAAPLLGIVPHQTDLNVDAIAGLLDIDRLLT